MEKNTYDLTSPQKPIWLTEQYYKKTAINTICGYVFITDKVNLEVLKKAINELVKTNDAMRIRLQEQDGSAVQYIEEYKEFDIDTIALKDEKEIEKTALKMANTPFFENDKNLYQFILYRLQNGTGGFIVNVHHLIGDSWSLGLIAKEVTSMYAEILNHTYEPKLKPSYVNYIEAEKEYKNSDKWIKDKTYWEEVFQTVPEIASLVPGKKETKKEISCVGKREKFMLSEADLAQINSFCNKHRISAYNFFMAIYSLYLSRVSGLDDFVMGTPILNRTNFEQKHTMGMFISVAPLRVKLNHESSFVEFVQNIGKDTMSIFRHQKYSYQSILEDLRKKDSSIPNLYNVILSYQITRTTEEENGVKYITDWVFNGNSSDELQIHLFDLNEQGKMTIAYDYNAELLNTQEIGNLHNRILCMVHQIMENDSTKLKDIEIITAEEKHQILNDFNHTHMEYPQNKTIVDLFEEQVEKTPDNIAAQFEKQKLTYRELNEKANQLARYLVENNVKAGDIVGIYLNKSLEVIISMFAILKAGAAFLPLDIEYPQDRLNYIIENSKPKLILSSKKINCNIKISTILVDLTEEIYQNKNITNLNVNLCPEDLMYIMYTSGSTGNPKGVAVKHKNIIRLAAFPNFITFSQNEVMVQTGTIVFDACIFEIFGSLLHGFKLHILKKENILDVEYFEEFLEKEEVTILFLTTGLFNELGLQRPRMFHKLKYLLTGGDVISKTSIQKIRKECPSLKIINCYGPTENGSYSTCYEIQGNEDNIPIGKPITNSTAYVVSNGNLCPIGVTGELWVGGEGVAKGYLNNEKLTKEQFIPNPFGEGMVYKTGDLVKWLPDGNIEFIGRSDNQVKVRGFRIELAEIDRKVLEQEKDIKQSLTIVQTINGTKTICTYIVSDNQIDTKKLKNTLGRYLPTYMLPTFITQLKEFPLNINGKVDKKAFPIPNNREEEKNIIPARNELDATIIDTLKDVLKIDNISIEDSFFDLGGDSLSAIAFTSSLTQKLQVSLSVNDVFKHPTMKELSDEIASRSKENHKNTIKEGKIAEYYPASNAQKRIYYASNVEKDSILYNIAGGIIVDNTLDIKKLEKCFGELINRHDVLRTHFDIVEDDIVQMIDEKLDFTLEEESEKFNDLDEIYKNFIKPFDLKKAPLFRAKVVKMKDNKMLLLLDMHHMISDGTSLNILLQELCTLYNGEKLPEKQIDYKDFTIWEKEQIQKEEYKKIKDYWVNQYQDEIPLLNMPTTYTRPSVQSFEGANFYAKLPKEVYEKVNEMAKRLKITPYMLLLSVYYILLSKYTMQDDIIIGTPIVGREIPELRDMLGMFVNTLALRNKVDETKSFHEFTNIIKEYCLEAFKNQTYPFDELVKELNIKRDTSRNPLFDVAFIYQNNGYPKMNLNNANTEYFIPENKVSKFDLSLEIIPIDGEYSLRYEYCKKLYDEEFIKRLSLHYNHILTEILENVDVKIADIDMITEEEKHQILYEFNNTSMEYPHDNLINLFYKIVKEYPNNIAILDMKNEITYQELDRKSNDLANTLYKQGIRNGDVVGVCLNRSAELITSIWAILKLGATYMPMYIGYPEDRLNYMISDSNAKILITNLRMKDLFKKSKKVIIDDFSEIGTLDNFNVSYPILPSENAYIIYTSGSTGKPKGVKISHNNLINFIYSFNSFYDRINPYDNFLATTNISFDVSIWELFMPILNGAKLVLNTEEILTNIIDYCQMILEKQITTLYIPPNILNEVYELLKNSEGVKINKLLVGVEGIKKETLNKFFEINPDIKIVNGYGPTETTICATTLIYNKDLNNVNSFVSIGRPLPNNRIYILDKSLQMQAIGIPGEIYIGGLGVGNGYINNVEANKKSFVKIDGQIFYKSGDLAKWNKDGTIDFIGRIDNQIKLNGYRIELNEISSVILSYPNINKCYTTIMRDNNNPYLVSYFTSDSTIVTKDLKAYLQTKLTFYMIPKFLIQIEEMPITVNGKIDNKALPEPDYKSDIPLIEPRDEFERKISKILCKLLNLKQISIDENFFDVGCDSMIAIKLQIEALKENIDISYGDIFGYPTIRMLSENRDGIKNINMPTIDTNYDYTNINEILVRNKINSNKVRIKEISKNSILLLGSTGFLGAHILDNYLSKFPEKTIYCIVRRKSLINPSERLKKTLNYYFGEKYDNYFSENKIIVIEGDMTQKNFGLSIEQLNNLMDNIDIIINSAALVKHYGNYETFSKINIEGTKTIINICKEYKKKLYHISTLSVSEMGVPNIDKNKIQSDKCIFDETSFYINQQFNNIYIYTKFEAERNILEQIKNGLDATILRVGNLTNRFSDGMFQMNVSENAFVNKMKSIISLGVIQKSFLEHGVELTPVDLCADAIIRIVSHNHHFSVLHLFNHNFVRCTKLLECINGFGYRVYAVSDKEFAEYVTKYLDTNNLKNSISGIVTDLSREKTLDYTSNVVINGDISNDFLKEMNFQWPILDEEYLKKYFEFFNKINYFTTNEEE